MTHEDVYLIFKTQHKNKMANYFIESNTQFKGKVTSIITDHTKKKKNLNRSDLSPTVSTASSASVSSKFPYHI